MVKPAEKVKSNPLLYEDTLVNLETNSDEDSLTEEDGGAENFDFID